MKRFTLARIWSPRTYSWLAKYYDRLAVLFSPAAGQQEVLSELETGCILDAGCGTGSLLELASQRGLECFGLDSSPGMLAETRRKLPEARLVLGSFYEMPFASGSFDYVVETNALGGVHLDARLALSEMLRVCRNGGEVRLADYAAPPEMTWFRRVLISLGAIIGDYPVDFKAIFATLGYPARVRFLGGYDLYQSFTVRKE